MKASDGRGARAPGGATSRTYARGGARSDARVASSNSRFLEEGNAATRRWTRDEMGMRLASAPAFRHPRPDEDLLSELVAGYEQITKDPVLRPRKRNLIAACYRVHGAEGFLEGVVRLFSRNGTFINLLGELRTMSDMDLAALQIDDEELAAREASEVDRADVVAPDEEMTAAEEDDPAEPALDPCPIGDDDQAPAGHSVRVADTGTLSPTPIWTR